MPAYLSCPLCVKSTLSDVQELQMKIASALCRSLHCPICSASLQGLPSLHFHLATHIPIQENGLQTISLPASPEHIPAMEKLEIRDESNSPASKAMDTSGLTPATKDEEIGAQMKSNHYNCEFCGLVFSSEYFLTLHKDIMHSEIDEFEVECKQCKCRFKNLEAYRDHVKEVHSDRRYICDQCPKSFKIKGGLLVHTRMFHDQSTPSSCQVCKKNFTSKARKELHERRYHHKAGRDVTKRSSPIQSPSLKDKVHDLGNAKNCLENLMKGANQHKETSPSQSLISADSSHDYLTSNVSLHDIRSPSTPVHKSIKVSFPMENQQNKKENSHQTVERQISCPPVLPSFEEEKITKYNHNIIPKKKKQAGEIEQKLEVWKTEDTQEPSNSQPFDHLIKKHYNCHTINASTTVPPPFHFNNVAYPIPKYSDFKIGDLESLFPISPLVSSGSIGGKAYLPNSNQYNLQEVNNCAEVVRPLQVLQNSTPKLPDHLQLEPQNICPSLPNPSLLQNEIPNSRNIISLSNASPNIQNSTTVGIPADYTITLPPNVNMNISCLVNTINSPTNTISNMKNPSVNPAPPLSSDPSMCNQKSTNETSDNEYILQNKEEVMKPKFPVKRTNFCHRGSEGKQWECEECKKSFTTKYFLKKHKRLHTGETPYSCEECGKTFTFQQSYHKHVFYHSDDKPHICPHCSRAFKEMSTLHNHVRIHTGEKPFVCTTCGKSFRQRVSYLVHQRIHTGILPYRCEICNRAFRYKVSLRSHKCEGRNGGETASNASKHVVLEEANSESFSSNSSLSSPKNSKESPSDKYSQAKNQEILSNQQNLGLRVGTLSSDLNELQETSPPSLSPRSAELQKKNFEFNESDEKGMNSVAFIVNERGESAKLLHIPAMSNINVNRSLIQSNAIESSLARHSTSKVMPKLEVSKTFLSKEDEVNDNVSHHLDNKDDHIGLPNLNMSDSFLPMNLDEDLENDTFLKSLFS